MKKIYVVLVCFTFLTLSCISSGNETLVSKDIIVGAWLLESQLVNGTETINDCKKQTQFIFESNKILRQRFYNISNGICNSGNEIIYSWSNINSTEYKITSPDGSNRNLEFTFTEENTKFRILETNSNDIVTISNFKKSIL